MRLVSLLGRATVLALVGLTGCATAPMPDRPPEPADELITYEGDPGPFCGRCDAIKFAAASDGRVWIEESYWAGHYRDRRTIRRLVQVTPEQFSDFRVRLALYRPSSDVRLTDESDCASFTYDLGEVRVAWRGGGADASLNYNFGCNLEASGEMRNALRNAPSALGLTGP